MVLKKSDFIEIDFTARTAGGDIFDSNIKKDLDSIGSKSPARPFIFALGHEMFLKGVDEFLIGKELGDYKIDLTPEKAFGKRDAKLVQMVPSRVFKEQKLNPFPGATFNFDGRVGRVLTVSSGRIMVDFNNPLAGKDVSYNIKVRRVLENINEKIDAFNEFLFKKKLKFKIKDKNLVIYVEKGMTEFIMLFKDKFKDVLGLNLKVEEIKEEEKKDEIIKEDDKPKTKN